MTRFADMIRRGMKARGHEVELWTSRPQLSRFKVPSAFMRKWLGYVDQFISFPRELRRRVAAEPADTVFVVTDQALGMWVPYLAHRPHVIHCHDFLALRSALGEFPENVTSWTGQQYQSLIRRGFSRGEVFVSDSEKTREDLHRFLPHKPKKSVTVHIGLNYPFRPMEPVERISLLKKKGLEVPAVSFILHVGGNQWYKNRQGVLEIYRAYAANYPNPVPLWLVGAPPTGALLAQAAAISSPGQIQFLTGLDNEQVNAAYGQARVLLFPSLEEGFGWPIAEGMAAGCPVITTDAAPMTEVAGPAARLIPRRPATKTAQVGWARSAAAVLHEVVNLNSHDREKVIRDGQLNAARFDPETALTAYERIYAETLERS